MNLKNHRQNQINYISLCEISIILDIVNIILLEFFIEIDNHF
jgi:hypothetical protein